MLWLGVLFLAASWSAQAQYDPEAKAALDAMSRKYKNSGAFTASFSQQIENASSGLNEKLNGKITVKGEKYKLEIADSEIYNNGRTVWVYTPDLSEVTVSNYEPEAEEITPGNVYDLYKKGFKYALVSRMSNGDQIIELSPESRDKDFHKIRMIIAANDDLKKFIIFDKNGTQYTYTIENFRKLSSLRANFFNFEEDQFPNVEVVDFR
jgi:outer membrane lipoprotein-sorting protein